MKNNNSHIILMLAGSVLISFLSILIYDQYFVDRNAILLSEKSKAYQVAENELLLSEKLTQRFRSAIPTDFVQAAESSRKGVVFVKSNGTNNQNSQTLSNLPFLTGSGVIISSDGYIVTNHHVIDGASRIEITLNDNRVYNASLIGTDPSTDLSLIKIEALQLDYLLFGNSDSLLIGEWVMAVGNPFRLQSTVTAGIVSAKARNINILENQGIESFIQTDAAVNPGNSGGALINTNGDLVGICAAILSNSGKYEGFSFAIPSNLVKKVVSDLKEYGVVQRGWLGIEIENIDNQIAKRLELNEVSGILISSVFKDGGAFDAGIKTDDVIISVNNSKTSNTAEFMEQLAQYRPGDEIQILLVRNQKKVTLKAVLRNQLNSTDLIGVRDDGVFKQIGIEVRSPDKYERAVIAPIGIFVVSVKNGTLIAATKMEPGYVITHINNKEVTSINMLTKQLEVSKGKTIIFDGYYPKIPGEFPYTFTMPE